MEKKKGERDEKVGPSFFGQSRRLARKSRPNGPILATSL